MLLVLHQSRRGNLVLTASIPFPLTRIVPAISDLGDCPDPAPTLQELHLPGRGRMFAPGACPERREGGSLAMSSIGINNPRNPLNPRNPRTKNWLMKPDLGYGNAELLRLGVIPVVG
jgi:hypothetical protein